MECFCDLGEKILIQAGRDLQCNRRNLSCDTFGTFCDICQKEALELLQGHNNFADSILDALGIQKSMAELIDRISLPCRKDR